MSKLTEEKKEDLAGGD